MIYARIILPVVGTALGLPWKLFPSVVVVQLQWSSHCTSWGPTQKCTLWLVDPSNTVRLVQPCEVVVVAGKTWAESSSPGLLYCLRYCKVKLQWVVALKKRICEEIYIFLIINIKYNDKHKKSKMISFSVYGKPILA